MTLKRQKWWDSLPATQKYLRREILSLKYKKSEEKLRTSTTWSVTIRKVALKRINSYTAHIRALKHELDRTTVVTYVGHIKEGVPSYQCKKCGGMFEDFEQSHCCWCGREIKEWKDE